MMADVISVDDLEPNQVRVKDSNASGRLKISNADTINLDLVGKLQNLSPGRQKLMTKYFSLGEAGEDCPVLGEYFAVALAFTALGALLRLTNGSTLKKQSREPDESGVKESPRIQRMALDAMLKEAMERLKKLAEERKLLEDTLRERWVLESGVQKERIELLRRATRAEALVAMRIESEAAWARERQELLKRVAEADAQRGYFFKQMTESEAQVAELQRIRAEDGKGNARLVGIYATREQAWKLEKIRLTQEIEGLKEQNHKLKGQVRAIVLQGDKGVNPETQRRGSLKRRALEVPAEKLQPEREIDIRVDAILPNPRKTEKPRAQNDPVIKEKQVAGSTIVDNDQTGAQEVSVPESMAQQQDMELELANILRKVGQLKKRGSIGNMLTNAINSSAFTDPEVDNLIEAGNLAEIPGEPRIKDVREVTKAVWKLDETNRISSSIMQAPQVEVSAITHASSAAETNNPLNISDNIVDSTYNNIATNSDGIGEIGSENVLARKSSLEQLEEELEETGSDSFLARKSSLEQLEDELGEVIRIPDAILKNSSGAEIFLEPILSTSARLEVPSPVDAEQSTDPGIPGQRKLIIPSNVISTESSKIPEEPEKEVLKQRTGAVNIDSAQNCLLVENSNLFVVDSPCSGEECSQTFSEAPQQSLPPPIFVGVSTERFSNNAGVHHLDHEADCLSETTSEVQEQVVPVVVPKCTIELPSEKLDIAKVHGSGLATVGQECTQSTLEAPRQISDTVDCVEVSTNVLQDSSEVHPSLEAVQKTLFIGIAPDVFEEEIGAGSMLAFLKNITELPRDKVDLPPLDETSLMYSDQEDSQSTLAAPEEIPIRGHLSSRFFDPEETKARDFEQELTNEIVVGSQARSGLPSSNGVLQLHKEITSHLEFSPEVAITESPRSQNCSEIAVDEVLQDDSLLLGHD